MIDIILQGALIIGTIIFCFWIAYLIFKLIEKQGEENTENLREIIREELKKGEGK